MHAEPQLKNTKIFSKNWFNLPFWQLDFHPDSRYITTFYANNSYLKYRHLTVGVKPGQGSQTNPIFVIISYTHLIHDDLVLAATNLKEHK